MVFYCLVNHFCLSGLRVREHLGRMAEAEMKLTTLGAFFRTVCHAVGNHLPTEDVNCVCGYDGVLIRVCQGMVRNWFAIGIFYVLRPMHYNLLLSLLAIAWFAEVDWDSIGVDWFASGQERSNFTFILPSSRVTHERAEENKVIEGGQDESVGFIESSLPTEVCIVVLLSGLDIDFLRTAVAIRIIRCWASRTE